jgi:signal transduction histidine kinase
MRSRRPWSIRRWLGSLVAGVAVPLLLLLIWIFVTQLRREQLEARESALGIARATAKRLGAQHRDSQALLEQMAARPAIRNFDGRTCDSLFAIVDPFPQWSDLLLFDGNGKVVCSADPRGEDLQVSLSVQNWLQSALGVDALQSGLPAIRRLGSHWVSVLSRPVASSDGRPRGLLVLLQRLDLTGSEALPPSAVITIVDRSGTIVARSSDPDRWVGRNAANSGVTVIASRQPEGIAEARGVDGVSRQYGFTQLPDLGWTISVGVPSSDVMAPVRQMFIRGAEGGALIIFSIMVVAFMLSRAVERPVGALLRAAESAARGSYERVDSAGGPLEIAKLSSAFNEMLDSRSRAERQTQESERNLKALSERLLVVQEQERMRVARELHDDLGQALTGLKMDVIGLLQRVPPSPLSDRILRTLDSTVSAVQRISSELRPSMLDDLGLIAALESEAQLFEERSGIECEISFPENPPQIDSVSATAIYRIVQEALTNVARHSNATRVELRLRERAEDLLLEIRDDGRGIEPHELNDAASLGLIGIRERADMVGGTVQFEGVPGRGTIVSVRIPSSVSARSGP